MDEPRLREAHSSTLFAIAKAAYFAELGSAGIVVAVLWTPTSAGALLGWFALLLMVTLGRIALQWRYFRAPVAARQAPSWKLRFVLAALSSGAAWAVAVVAFFSHHDPLRQMALVAAVLGVVMWRIHLDTARLRAAEEQLRDDLKRRVAAEQALTATEAMYRNLVETSGELIWSLDLEGRWTHLNAAGSRRIYGREAADMIRRPQTEVVARGLRERDEAVVRRVLSGESVIEHETRHVRADGSPVDLSFNAIPLRDLEGNIVGATGTARDITERKRAAAALHESVEKLRLAVQAADLRYWEWEAGRDGPGLPGAAGDDLVHAEDRERCASAWGAAIARGEPYEVEYRASSADGELLWFSSRGVPMLDTAGKAYRMIGVSQDITARKRREEAVRFLAYHDALTGLPNRRLLDDRLKQALYAAQRRSRKVAAMLIDIDDFKRVNDSLGHRAGDAVLREVANRLASCVRKADTLARHGGDEFVVVLSDVQSYTDCQVVADKVLRAMEKDFRVEGDAFRIGASIGISLYPEEGSDGDALLRNADAAMYRAKQLGRNRYSFYGR